MRYYSFVLLSFLNISWISFNEVSLSGITESSILAEPQFVFYDLSKGKTALSLHYYDGNNEGKSKFTSNELAFDEDCLPFMVNTALFMQICADVTGRELKLPVSSRICAFGSAMAGA